MSTQNGNHTSPINLDEDDESLSIPKAVETTEESKPAEAETPRKNPLAFATRANARKAGENKNLLLVGGVIALAVAFFLFAQFHSGPLKKKPKVAAKTGQQQPQPDNGGAAPSTTPMMDPVPQKSSQSSDRVTASQIRGTGKPVPGTAAGTAENGQPASGAQGKPLGAVPSFNDTQQKWQDPAPYKNGSQTNENASASQGSDKELTQGSNIVYVRAPRPDRENGTSTAGGETVAHPSQGPRLQLREGTRIEARLENQISTSIHAPVVAVVENTYAIGDRILVPAGARIFGKLSQADASGNVGVEFNQIELVDGTREGIDAIGTGLDLGPIQGDVYGKHNGRNFLIRALSGLGSTATMLVGTNVNGAYSASDMIRQRAGQNIGTAADTQLTELNANTHIIVSVPANTKIYVMWTEHAKNSEQGTAPNERAASQ